MLTLNIRFLKIQTASNAAKSDLKDYTGAIADYNKGIQLKPDIADAYSIRGVGKMFLQDYRGAIADLNKAIQLNPYNANFYYTRGNLKDVLKDKTRACLDWSKAGELGYSDAYTNIQKYCK